MALSYTLDKLGPLCLTADDCGLVLEAISGSDPDDPSTSQRDYSYESSKRSFRLAIIKDGTDGINEEVDANFQAALETLGKFATVEEAEFPDLPYEAITRVILSAEAASAHEEFIESGKTSELTAPEDHYGAYPRMVVLAKDYIRAMRLRGRMARAADGVMSGFDAVVAPTSRSVASPIAEEFRRTSPGTSRNIMGAVGNGAGLPSISVPSGFTDAGLPTGIQFMGRAYAENTIIAIAKGYQERTDWHRRHPADTTP